MKQFVEKPEATVDTLDTVALLKLVMKTPNGERIMNLRKTDGTTLLLDAVKKGKKHIVKYLLSVKECDINARDEHGAHRCTTRHEMAAPKLRSICSPSKSVT